MADHNKRFPRYKRITAPVLTFFLNSDVFASILGLDRLISLTGYIAITRTEKRKRNCLLLALY